MNIEIKKLTPELADDYVHFFDTTPHDDFVPEHKCYCVCWCSEEFKDQDFPQPKKEDNMPTNMSKKVLFRDI
jgi:hypothetical protein